MVVGRVIHKNSRKGNIRYVFCFQRLLENKLLLKVEMFTSVEKCFMPLTGNYFTASQAPGLFSGYVSLTQPNNIGLQIELEYKQPTLPMFGGLSQLVPQLISLLSGAARGREWRILYREQRNWCFCSSNIRREFVGRTMRSLDMK